MSQSVAHVLIHAVWSTKARYSFFTQQPLRNELHRCLSKISAGLDCPTLIIGSMPDHVHVLLRLADTITVADWVHEMKRASSAWLVAQARRDPLLSLFHWQSGYGAFSVSESTTHEVSTYIANQEAHHQRITFQDEYRRFLKVHGIPWDEQYMWE